MRLKLALEGLDGMLLDQSVKDVIALTLKAASNPDNESIGVVMKTLPKDRRAMIEKTAKGLRALSNDVMVRGKQRLMAMSEDDWQKLLNDEAN